MKRRKFVASGLTASTLSPLFLRKVPALAGPMLRPTESDLRHNFVFFQLSGAWDICLAFDPKDREALNPEGAKQFDQPYSATDIIEKNGIKLAPAAHSFASYTDRMAVVNGIDMLQDLGHQPTLVMTGVTTPTGSLPFVQAVLAAEHPYLKTCFVPHLFANDITRDFQTGRFETSTVRSTLTNFVETNSPARFGLPLDRMSDLLSDYAQNFTTAPDRQSFEKLLVAVRNAQTKEADLALLKNRLPANLDGWKQRGQALGIYFDAGIVGAATFNFSFQGESIFMLDTHNDHYNRHELPRALEAIRSVIEGLESVTTADGRTAFDSTTIVVTAEYCRTPLLNASMGKDHNTNSNTVVILGKNVKNGSFGASGYRKKNGVAFNHAGLPVNFATGLAQEDGQVLNIINIWRGLERTFGASFGTWLPQAPAVNFL